MFHNSLFHLERSQKRTLSVLGIIFLIFSVLWFFAELFNWPFPMEPIVVFIGGMATLLASFWPFKPGYSGKRLKGRNTCDYETNNNQFTIGRDELEFTLQFSKANHESIHIYHDPENIKAIALVKDAGKISELKDAKSLDYSNRTLCPKEGQIICLENKFGNFACVHIHDIKDASRNDNQDEVTFSYIINPNQGINFS